MNRLKAVLRGQTPLMAILALTGLLNAVLVLLLNRGYAGMIDAAAYGRSQGIAATALALALLAVASGAVSAASAFLCGKIAENAGHRLRTGIAERLLGAECSALERRHSGDSLSRANVELKQAVDWVKGQLCAMVTEAAMLLCVLAAMAAVNWRLTAAAFAVVPAVALYAARASKPIRAAEERRQQALAGSNALVKSVMDAFPILKLFTMAGVLISKHAASVDAAVGMAVKANGTERLLMTVNGLSTLIPVGILLGWGGAMAISGAMTPGALLVFLNLSNYVTGPIMNLPNRIAAARGFSANLKRIEELREEPQETGRPQNRRIPDMNGKDAIVLANASFSYAGGQQALRKMSLSVPQGSRVALVGPSGCGKSTVIKLLAALYLPQEGHVFVLGRDTRKWELAELRSRIAAVMQDPFLFPGSIRENVSCGQPMPLERVLGACRAAGLAELLETLPQGIETDVGERGAKLSGGQRQRVAIARAVAKDAPILLLDEATSALDAATEREIQGALDNLARGRTTLAVTHRMASARYADRICCMDGGAAAEWGTHDELMALDGLYASLVKQQSGAGAGMERSAS